MRRAYGVLERNPATATLVALVLGVFASLAVAGVFVRGEDTRQIVVNSPCLSNPASDTCQKVKANSDREQELADACISPRKYLKRDTYRDETRCPHGPRRSDGSTTTPRPSGDPDPGQRSGPVPVGPADAGGGSGSDGGGGAQPEPPSPPDPSPPDPDPPTPPDPPDPPAPTPPTLSDTVDGVTGAACEITGVCIR